jgi:hypothetical protein
LGRWWLAFANPKAERITVAERVALAFADRQPIAVAESVSMAKPDAAAESLTVGKPVSPAKRDSMAKPEPDWRLRVQWLRESLGLPHAPHDRPDE